MCLKGRKKKEKNEGGISGDSQASGYYKEIRTVCTEKPPDWIEIYPRMVRMGLNANPGKPTHDVVAIKNLSEKKVAYKLFSSEKALFTITPPSGIMQPDEQVNTKIDFQNQVQVNVAEVFLLHFYYAFMESDVVPEEFRPENDLIPRKYDGEHLVGIYMLLGQTRVLMKKVPPEIDISGTVGAPQLLTFYPDSGSKRPTAYITILNSSTSKYCAFTIRNTNGAILRMHRRCGVIPPGQRKMLLASCKAQPDMSKKDFFYVFIALIDTEEPPEQFKKTYLLLPTEYDACRTLDVVWGKETCPTGGGASHEPLSQTGAPETVDEADAPAPDAPGAPSSVA